ncbi:MAG: DNA gyrase subunit A [Tenericutes bacterium GWC2_34_14]|nr:MAG: DNA gyrase subunit A [Tenericutes bacterium GWC2_34_14]OHE32942.1 MAG: DNA gyrase subunit A [Tenericutes bacterium GWE2_34_108]OHE36093.1 MAG: DNA gyrase subunit A [Tenericutes bacterium GWF1_35_14]OHE39316.1 MAG: DNA gyrase subunit A [Tenericutes bacterium GWF2_35_184]OHE44589.1 MAG: DNA gyrase subunit A [Tenericutes bacterium RIFOXYA2_FULL_36_32]OHE47993.1 MAG: DNA gyrase subunit A [Tenericutes bacterium RIFOXYB2_FULL_36_25]OHE48817.1 MAG: DNA gyrase subunit A [Tenericutes bacterium
MDQTFNTQTSKTTEGYVKEINISSEMKTSFLNYAMSVIVSRALPDIRDGLKPVQRRILYAMNDLGMSADKPHKKSARIVGEVIGKYHPHGDSSVYDAMVRMAQPFNYRMPLIDGHGNFGSVDGDGAAAMRYTEARMSKLAGELVRDLEKNTVDYVDNYDGSEHEPSVLPARYPNLLVNGSTGIAVGMATNIPPHNLGEVIDGLLAYMEDETITIAELMQYIKGPDFPTGGQILGLSGLRQAYETGRGIIANRATAEIVTHKNKQAIVVTAIPYAVNKTTLIERIADIAKEKIVEGITDLRDESNRKGMRIVIELKRDVNPHVMLNNLYKHTQLQQSFGFNMICLVKGQPQMVTLKDLLKYYVEHQIEVIQRRTVYDLEKAEARQHILDGLVIALHDVDRAIDIIKASKTGDEARDALIAEYGLSDIQARAILDMRLQRLTGIEIEKIEAELQDLIVRIKDYKEIIASHPRKIEIIKQELLEIKANYADARVTEINLHEDLSIENEDLIPVEDVIITVTNNGYIKRMNVDHYKTQNRGGVGMSGIKVHEDDYVEHIRMTSTHDFHLFFTNKGRVYKIKGYKIPEGSRQSKGLPIVNLLEFQKDEHLASFTNVKDFEAGDAFLTFVTKKGIIKRTPIQEYANIRTNGINAINLREDDELLSVGLTDGKQDIILGASNGKAIRFDENDARAMGRTTSGVRGMDIGENDEVVGAAIISNNDEEILVITENGFGKRTNVDEYRRQIRGGKGVKTLNVTEKNGKLSTLRVVSDDQDLIVVSDKGVVIRTHVDQISQTKRATQGVRIIRLRPDHKVSTIALVPRQEEIEEDLNEEGQFVQETINVNEPKKVIEAIHLAPDEVEEVQEEVVTTGSLLDEE